MNTETFLNNIKQCNFKKGTIISVLKMPFNEFEPMEYVDGKVTYKQRFKTLTEYLLLEDFTEKSESCWIYVLEKEFTSKEEVNEYNLINTNYIHNHFDIRSIICDNSKFENLYKVEICGFTENFEDFKKRTEE